MFSKLSREETILLSGSHQYQVDYVWWELINMLSISVVGVEAKARLFRVWIW